MKKMISEVVIRSYYPEEAKSLGIDSSGFPIVDGEQPEDSTMLCNLNNKLYVFNGDTWIEAVENVHYTNTYAYPDSIFRVLHTALASAGKSDISVGDECFFLWQNTIKSGTVTKVKSEAELNAYKQVVKTSTYTVNDDYILKEQRVFRTKQELLNSL